MTSNKSDNFAGIVLAAGRSRRFGADKRLVRYDAGHNLLGKSISLLVPQLDHIVVAMRLDDAERTEALLGQWFAHPKVEQFFSPSADKGMGHSLAESVVQLCSLEQQRGHRFTAVMIMLGDMPAVRSSTITRLLASSAEEKIVRPCYRGGSTLRPGHPVVFGRQWFEELQTLKGDRGARAIVEGNPAARIDVEVDDLGILFDVDMPADLDLS